MSLIYSYRKLSIDGRYLINFKTDKQAPVFFTQKGNTSIRHLFNVSNDRSVTFILEAQIDIYFPESFEVQSNEMNRYCQFELDIISSTPIPVIPTNEIKIGAEKYPDFADHPDITSINTGEILVADQFAGETVYSFSGSSAKKIYDITGLQGIENYEINLDYQFFGTWSSHAFSFDDIQKINQLYSPPEWDDNFGLAIRNATSSNDKIVQFHRNNHIGQSNQFTDLGLFRNTDNVKLSHIVEGLSHTVQVYVDGVFVNSLNVTLSDYAGGVSPMIVFLNDGLSGSSQSRLRSIEIIKK